MSDIDLNELDKYKEPTVDDKICPHCGYSNPKWMTECEMCCTSLETIVESDKDD